MHDYDKGNKVDLDITKQKDLPIYTAFTTAEFMYPEVGREYEIGDWEFNGEDREFTKEFEGLLIAARQYDSFDDLENVTLAYVTEEVKPDKAESKIQKYIESSNDLLLVVFLRVENAKEFVMNGDVNI